MRARPVTAFAPKAPVAAETDGRRLRGDRKRAMILERAMELASTRGLEAITLGELADDLAINKSNLTVLFGDKQSLQIAILDAAVELFVQHIIEPVRAIESPLERLAEISERWYAYLDQRVFPGGCFLYGAINEYRARSGVLHEHAAGHFEAWKKFLTREVQLALDAGEADPEIDAGGVVFSLMAYQNSAHLAILLGDRESFERARRMAHDEVAGIRRRSGRPGNELGPGR